MPDLFVDVAVPVAVDRLFTYSVPAELQPLVQRGVRVLAPFGKRNVIGIVINLSNTTPKYANIRSISDLLDAAPIMSDELLDVSRWIADYYFAPVGEVVKAMVVQGSTHMGKRTVRRLTPVDAAAAATLTSKQLSLLNALPTSAAIGLEQLRKKLSLKNIYSVVNSLAQKGVVAIEETPLHRGPKPKRERTIEVSPTWKSLWQQWLSENATPRLRKQSEALHALAALEGTEIDVREFLKRSRVSLSTVRTLEQKNLLALGTREVIRRTEYELYESSLGAQNIILNSRQNVALDSLRTAIDSKTFHPFLLHGVTGSGKTQVYIEAIRHALEKNLTAIVLVPEISLTPQIVRRFRQHFGEKVVALHSRMSVGERYDAWRMTHEGKYSVVIGPRSAVFAPLRNLGLIVVDEEHEASYKQFDPSPRYHARDVAMIRAKTNNAVIVLGSATPSLESFTNTSTGKYALLELPDRVDTAQLPQIEIIDMVGERRTKLTAFRAERKDAYKANYQKARDEGKKFEFSLISDTLQNEINKRLAKKEGIILLQNRRGYAPFVECPDCGYVERCENCNISLTYHQTKKHLRCHYCGFTKQPPDVCPTCHGTDIRYLGYGTQRVEEELIEIFPTATMVRMDLDTTSQKGSHDRILRKFSDGEVDILLGTQMVAKGLDFSRVTLVGVISADTQMLLPDFRSAERTFQLLTQVAGRSGRSALTGEVVIQTSQPDHYTLKHVLTHDYHSFYNEEMAYRKELHYPPFSRIALIEVRGENEQEVTRNATAFADLMKGKSPSLLVLGPAPAALPRLRNQFRWHIVVKDVRSSDPSGAILHRTLRSAHTAYRSSQIGKSRSVTLIVDVDPQGML